MPSELKAAARQATNRRFPATSPVELRTGRCALRPAALYAEIRHGSIACVAPPRGPRRPGQGAPAAAPASPAAAVHPVPGLRPRRALGVAVVAGVMLLQFAADVVAGARDGSHPRAHGLHVVRAPAAHARALDRVRMVAASPDDGGQGPAGRGGRRDGLRERLRSAVRLRGAHDPGAPAAHVAQRAATRSSSFARRSSGSSTRRCTSGSGPRVRVPVRHRGDPRARPRGAAAPQRGRAGAAAGAPRAALPAQHAERHRGARHRGAARGPAAARVPGGPAARRGAGDGRARSRSTSRWRGCAATPQILEARHRGALSFEWDVPKDCEAGAAARGFSCSRSSRTPSSTGRSSAAREAARSWCGPRARTTGRSSAWSRTTGPACPTRTSAPARSGCRPCAGASSSRRRTPPAASSRRRRGTRSIVELARPARDGGRR